MTLDTILAKLEQVKGKGNQYTALCPCHDDKQASLSITADNERIALHCFAGCTTENIVQSLSLTMSDLFLKPREAKTKKIVATYDYQDEAGQFLFQVCRLEPKSFRQRHRNGEGDWAWDMKGIRRVLYHLPDIIKAKTVYFVEGEKDCDALWDCGLVATTSPGGANSWHAEYADCLAKKNIILIPDNDTAGFAYMKEVARSLMGKATLSCILLPDKDIAEWLGKGNDPSLLSSLEEDIAAILVGGKPKYILEGDAIIWSKGKIAFKAEALRAEKTGLHGKAVITYDHSPLSWSVFNLERAEERTRLSNAAFKQLKGAIKDYTEADLRRDFDLFCAGLWEFYLSRYIPELIYGVDNPPPLSFALEPYIVDGGGTIIFSPPGRGKSYTGLLWAQSINAGVNKFWNIKQRPVMFINLERSKDSITRRLAFVNKILGLPAATPLLILNARGKSLSEVMHSCRQAIRQFKIKVIMLDSISRAGFGDLTENRPATTVIDALSSLCETWLALAHTPRQDEGHIFGSVHYDAGADIVVKLSSEVADSGTLGIGYEIVKSNDIRYFNQAIWTFEFDDNGLSSIRRARPFEFPEVESKTKKSTMDTIKDYIFAQDEADASATEIADSTGLNRGQVARLLCQSGKFVQTRKVGKSVFYGVKEVSPGGDK